MEELTSEISSWIHYYNHTRCKRKLSDKSSINYRTLTT
ncbi:IS3 family transposase [Lapidilactobacillus dextrinicus]|nr:IS3 family transposase [Lapidilactobacillus dextrinicus]